MIKFECDCSMGSHKAPLEGYDISSGAIKNIPEILKDYSKVYMVADSNTYAAAGEEVEKILKEAGKHYRTCVRLTNALVRLSNGVDNLTNGLELYIM